MSRRLLALLPLALSLACAAPAAAHQAPHNNAIHAPGCDFAQKQVRAYFNQAYALLAGYPFIRETIRPDPGFGNARPSLIKAMRTLAPADNGIRQHFEMLPAVNYDVAVACDPAFRFLR